MPFSGVFWPFPISSNPLLGIMLKMALQAKKAAVQILRHKREHQQLSSASISSIQTSSMRLRARSATLYCRK